MHFALHTWQLMLLLLVSWINEQQQQVIEYLRTEHQVLKEKLGKKRILLKADERKRLLKLGLAMGPALRQVITIVDDATFRRWVRKSHKQETVTKT